MVWYEVRRERRQEKKTISNGAVDYYCGMRVACCLRFQVLEAIASVPEYRHHAVGEGGRENNTLRSPNAC